MSHNTATDACSTSVEYHSSNQLVDTIFIMLMVAINNMFKEGNKTRCHCKLNTVCYTHDMKGHEYQDIKEYLPNNVSMINE
jgi:hypothetical protein